jgi:hypothetical protein
LSRKKIRKVIPQKKVQKDGEKAARPENISKTVECGLLSLVWVRVFMFCALHGFETQWFRLNEVAAPPFFRYPPAGL